MSRLISRDRLPRRPRQDRNQEKGPFLVVTTNNGVNVDFMNADGEIVPQHYAFLVDEKEFDEIFGRVRERSLPYWADPAQTQAGEINQHDGGAVSISRIRTGTSWKSSLALTAAAAGIHDAEVSLAAMETFPQLSQNLKWECSRNEPSPPVNFAGSRTRILVRNSASTYRWIWFHPTRICEVSARSGRLHQRASRNGIALILFAGLADDRC